MVECYMSYTINVKGRAPLYEKERAPYHTP